MNSILAAENLSKRFYATQALKRVSFNLFRGEVHALVGENGAGKSTLIKIFGGIHRAGSGRVLLDGGTVHFHSPADAYAAGIAVISQELRVVPQLAVFENVMLGHLPRKRSGLIDWKAARQRAREALDRLHFQPDLDAQVGSMSFAERQSVAIARALSRDARVLILDEPTAALEEREVRSLFEVIRRLKGQNVAILFVSHRLEEIPAIADRCTVMRDGGVVAEFGRGAFAPGDLVLNMTGRAVDVEHHARGTAAGEVLLEAALEPDLRLHARQLTGLAGLLGSGTTQLLRHMFGAGERTRERAGVRIRGREATLAHPSQAISAGIGMVQNERALGLVLSHTVRENIVLPHLRRFGAFWRMDDRAAEGVVRELIAALDIRPADPDAVVHSLSGGNQQKVALAKWLAGRIDVLLLDEPTQGIDVAAKAYIHRLMHEFAEKGGAVLFASSEIHEVMSLSDAVLAVKRNSISARLERGQGLSEQAVRDAMSG
ncbi:MAG: hypothetical protein A3I00_06640 [Betaproteobacteria bacterium RIFCSPLOWO2_02_FULL_64_12]|nr:MAG: hypothetical protein A3I00_06640 [Betaproteobacteria bacterium RIFCSPLOWO2_02_FULL_64_12]